MNQTRDFRQLLELWTRHVKERQGDTVGHRSGAGEELAALKANATLVQYLTSTRWVVILSALEAGADWDDLGVALDFSRGAV